MIDTLKLWIDSLKMNDQNCLEVYNFKLYSAKESKRV